MAKSYLERTVEFYNIYQREVLPLFREFEASRKVTYSRVVFYQLGLIILYILAIGTAAIALCLYEVDIALFCFSGVILAIALFIQYFYDKYAKRVKQEFVKTLKRKCLAKILKVFGDIEVLNIKCEGDGKRKLKQDISNHSSAQDTNITPNILEETLENQWAKIKHRQNMEDLHDSTDLFLSGLFVSFDRMETDDVFVGTHKGVDFKISEITLRVHYKNNYPIVYRGVVISFKSNKKINNRTIISTKGDLIQHNGWLLTAAFVLLPVVKMFMDKDFSLFTIIFVFLAIYVIIDIRRRNRPVEELIPIRLEGPKFNKKFNAYSSDEVEGRYLLTPAFCERFQQLKTAFGAKKAKCSFFGDTIMFAIETKKNLFEIGALNKTLEDPKSINDFYNELSSILKMIEYFKLDEKTGI